MNVKRIPLLIIAVWLIITLAACSGDDATPGAMATDYSQAAHWLSLPAVIKPVDVFYLYMTAWTSTDPANPHICAIDEPTMLIKAPETFAQQATAFETVGNIYAPFYRQDNGC
jgi:hypothetical protein